MRASQPRGGDIMHQAATDLGITIGGDAHADAGAAHENAKIGTFVRHRCAHRVREIRVIDAGRAIGAKVLNLMPALDQHGDQPVLEGDTTMVGPEGHDQRTSHRAIYHGGFAKGNR